MTTSLIERAPARLRPGVELTLRTIDDAIDDRIPGLAAEIAFFVLLSLPPLLLTVVAALGFVEPLLGIDASSGLVDRTVDLAGELFSQRTIEDVIEPTITHVVSGGSGGVATLGFIVTVFSASRALRVVSTAITIAYDLEESRPGWQQRIMGVALTLTGILLAVVIVPVIVAGPAFGETIAATLRVDRTFGDLYRILYWPIAGVAAWLLIASLYHFVAPWWTPWRRDLPGAALAMVLWLSGSVGLRVYASRSITGEESIYGPIAGPLVLLLWIYVSGFAVLIGAELNAEIERMWPTHHPDQRDPERRDPEPDRLSDEVEEHGEVPAERAED